MMLSVVIPTKDTRELILACLRSLDHGGGEPLEIIVVDDGSRDDTAERVQRAYPDVRLLRNSQPERFTRAANRGLAAAGGDLVLLLNSDTEVDPGSLGRLRRAFERQSDLGVAGAALRYPDGRPQWSGGAEPGLLWFWAKSSGAASWASRLAGYRQWRYRRIPPSQVHWVSGAAMVIRREVLETVGQFDPRFDLYAQDLDLCLTAHDAGWRVAVLPEFGVVHHHGATITAETQGATAQRQNLPSTWTDLLAWAEKRNGPRWASRAARIVRLGLAVRLASLRLMPPIVRPGKRGERRLETVAYRLTLDHLRDAARQRPKNE